MEMPASVMPIYRIAGWQGEVAIMAKAAVGSASGLVVEESRRERVRAWPLHDPSQSRLEHPTNLASLASTNFTRPRPRGRHGLRPAHAQPERSDQAFEPRAVQARVGASATDEIVRRAVFDDTTGVEHQHAVGDLHRRQTVGDDDRSAIGEQGS
jgi:hypothetical protein